MDHHTHLAEFVSEPVSFGKISVDLEPKSSGQNVVHLRLVDFSSAVLKASVVVTSRRIDPTETWAVVTSHTSTELLLLLLLDELLLLLQVLRMLRKLVDVVGIRVVVRRRSVEARLLVVGHVSVVVERVAAHLFIHVI